MEAELLIRPAETRDLAAIAAIYNDEVEHGTATFDIHPKPLSGWEDWFRDHSEGNHFALVGELAGETVSYASLSAYRAKEAYAATVELSIYIQKDRRGTGLGNRMMSALLETARRRDDIHTIVSVITGENLASVRLHEKFNFDYCGRVRQVGTKFGRYLDIVQYELIL